MNSLQDGLKRVVQRTATLASSMTPGSRALSPSQPTCAICGDAGFVRRDLPPGHPNFGRAIPCTCSRDQLQQRRQAHLYEVSNLGALSRFTFASFSATGMGLDSKRGRELATVYEVCLAYAEEPNGWLVLVGTYGCGKTHLAAAIANRRIEMDDQPLFVVVPDLLDHLRAAYAPGTSTTYDERFHQVRSAPLLILDDLGTHASTPWAQEKLFQIVNYRYNACLPTVITTNQSLDQLDPRIASRLGDPALGEIRFMTAPDFRQGHNNRSDPDLSSLNYLEHLTFQSFDLRTSTLSEQERSQLYKAYNTCRGFARDPSGWIALQGPCGVGKTHLAAAIANLYQQESARHNVWFVVVPDLLDLLRATFNPQSPASYDKRFEQLRGVPLLVLDDLGTQSATPWAQEKLFQLFNHRYMTRLPTVVTLNDEKTTDMRLLQRVREMALVGNGAMIHLSVPPYRVADPDKRNGMGRVVRGGRRRDPFDRDDPFNRRRW